MANASVSKYAHHSAATTVMPSNAAIATGPVSGSPRFGPSPSAMIDSPSATSTMSACRSAQCPAESTTHHCWPRTVPATYSTSSASVQSASCSPTANRSCGSRPGSVPATTSSAVATVGARKRIRSPRRRAGSARSAQAKTVSWAVRITK